MKSWRVCYYKHSRYAKIAPSIAQFIGNPCVWGMSCQTLLNIVFAKYCPSNCSSWEFVFRPNISKCFQAFLLLVWNMSFLGRKVTWWLSLRVAIITILLLSVFDFCCCWFYRNLFQTFYCFQFENEVDSVAEVKRLARCEVAQLFSTLCGRIFCSLIFFGPIILISFKGVLDFQNDVY